MEHYKLFSRLLRRHSLYEAERQQLLNHPVMIRYLFNKPVASNKVRLLRQITPIYCSSADAEQIQMSFLSLVKYSEDYQETLLEITSKYSYLEEYPMDNRFVHPETSDIADVLFNYDIDYTFGWNFKLLGDRTSCHDSACYNMDIDIRVDFLACIVVDTKDLLTKRLELVAIDHLPSCNTKVKAHQLNQMNIHYLVVNDCPKQTVKKFIVNLKRRTALSNPGISTGYLKTNEYRYFKKQYIRNRKQCFQFIDAYETDIAVTQKLVDKGDKASRVKKNTFQDLISKKYYWSA